jgi:hypothetical protein
MGTEAFQANEHALMLVNTDGIAPVKSLDERLHESDRAITESWVALNKRSMLIGWEGYFIKRYNGWERLGYPDEKSYRASKGIGRSTWYMMVDLAERLQMLSKEQFLSMSIENAEELAKAPSTMRADPALLNAAATMQAREFQSEVGKYVSLAENTPPKDRNTSVKWSVRQSQREFIESGLEEWQHEHGIDDPGYALELMIAEYHDKPTLVGFMAESIPRLTRAVTEAHSVEELEALRTLFAAHIQEMGEILKVCCGEGSASEEAA